MAQPRVKIFYFSSSRDEINMVFVKNWQIFYLSYHEILITLKKASFILSGSFEVIWEFMTSDHCYMTSNSWTWRHSSGDIQTISLFLPNIISISSSGVRKWYFHEWRSHEWKWHFLTSRDEIEMIFGKNNELVYLLYNF